METKKLALLGVLAVVGTGVFMYTKNLATPPPVVAVAPTADAPVAEEIAYVDVLIATEEIPFGTRLTESHMRWKQWPEEAVTSDFISNKTSPQALTELAGGVVRSVIFENEPISYRKIVKAGEQGLLASLLNPGMRAVTTRISVDTAAGGFIQPGDHVDIILTTSVTQSPTQQAFTGSGQMFSAKTIFENVRVLAIDQTFSTSSDSGATVIGSTATFEMSQTDSEILQASAAQGDITLTLRPMGSLGSRPGKSHATIKQDTSDVSSLTVYRNGQPQQVAIRGQ